MYERQVNDDKRRLERVHDHESIFNQFDGLYGMNTYFHITAQQALIHGIWQGLTITLDMIIIINYHPH